jgi:hypothetical protein
MPQKDGLGITVNSADEEMFRRACPEKSQPAELVSDSPIG